MRKKTQKILPTDYSVTWSIDYKKKRYMFIKSYAIYYHSLKEVAILCYVKMPLPFWTNMTFGTVSIIVHDSSKYFYVHY